MNNDKDKITFEWSLKRFHPRLDLYFPAWVDAPTLEAQFQFPVRIVDCTNVHRHYRLPVYFHLPFVREFYQRKISDAING